MSEEKGIYLALVGAMADIGAIAKDRRNEQQKYSFRGIDDVYNALQPALIKHGIVIVPDFTILNREERATRQGGVLIFTTVQGSFKFVHLDGSSIEVITIGEGADTGDKSSNKAMSTAYKYAVFQTLCVPTEDAVDPEVDSPQPVPKPNGFVEPQKPAGNKMTPAQVQSILEAAKRAGIAEGDLKDFVATVAQGIGADPHSSRVAEYLLEGQTLRAAWDAYAAAAPSHPVHWRNLRSGDGVNDGLHAYLVAHKADFVRQDRVEAARKKWEIIYKTPKVLEKLGQLECPL